MTHKHAPLFLAIALALAVSPVAAQQAPVNPEDARTLDTLIVTGTRVANRTVAESTSPIDVLSSEALYRRQL